MSNSIYINASAQSSKMLDSSTNHSYNYKLGDGVHIPKGTTVQIQNSFINSSGITGASINLQEDIDEKILIGYYLVDTSYTFPLNEAQPRTADESILPPGSPAGDDIGIPKFFGKLDYQRNIEDLYSGGIVNYPSFYVDSKTGSYNSHVGYSENPLPVTCIMNSENESNQINQYLQPLTTYIDINIKKGIYSVSKLTAEITLQINNQKIKNANDKSVYEVSKDNNEYRGTRETRSTTLKTLNTDTDTLQKIINSEEFGTITPGKNRALNYRDEFNGNIFGIKPSNFNKLLENFKNKNYTGGYIDEGLVDFELTNYLNNYYFKTLSYNLSDTVDTYGLFLEINSYIGSTDVKFDYDSTKGGFSVTGLSQIRRMPSISHNGVSNSNAGETVAYVQRVGDYNGRNDGWFWDGSNNGNTPESTRAIFNTLNTVLSRECGIYVLNWAVNHTIQTADIDLNLINPDFMRFEDFYKNIDSTKEAWKTSWIAQLGFSYNDLNETEEYIFYDQTQVQTMPGFTQSTKVDSSIITTISSTYNNINYAGEADGTSSQDIAAFKSIQTYNMIDTASCIFPICNSTTLVWPVGGQAEPSQALTIPYYNNSFYSLAQMFPILINTASTTASNLPVLNKNPYYIVSSDLISNSDIFNGNKNLPLLGVIPISSLSNEDFIYSSFSEIIVPITNDKFINDINITILNSDLSIPILGPNSSIILKLTFPNEIISLLPPDVIKKEEKEK